MAGENDTGVLGLAVPGVISYGLYAALKSSGADPAYLYVSGGIAGFCGALTVIKFLIETKNWLQLRRMLRPQGIYGTTKPLNSQSPKELGLKTSNRSGKGMVLGAKRSDRRNRLLFYDGDGHGLYVSGTGGGKSNSLSKPFRLSLGAEVNAIITAKGEDMAVSLYRFITEELRQTCVCIDPYRLMKAHGIKCDDYNPCDRLVELAREESPVVFEAAREIAKIMLVDPSAGGGDNKIFRDMGREFIALSLVLLAIEEAETGELCCNPAHLNRILSDGTDRLNRFFIQMASCPHYDDTVARAGRKFLSKIEKSAKSAESFLTEAQMALAPFEPVSAIGNSVEFSTFNPADLKTPGKGITVFIVLPLEASHLADLYTGLCVDTLASRCLAANRAEPRVVIIADEFENLSRGPLPVVERILKLGRTRGVQLHAFIQDLGGLEARYKELTSMFISQSAILMAFDIRSAKDAEMYSKRAGQQSIVTDSASASKHGAGSLNVKEEGIPLMRQDQFTQLPKFCAVLFKDQHPPMIVDLVHYKAVDPWNALVDDVPGVAPEPDFKVRFKA